VPLIYLSIAWLTGIYLASQLPEFPAAQIGLLTPLPLAVAWLWRKDARLRLGALCALFVLLGALRFALARPRVTERHVSAYNDRRVVTLTGVVVAEPDVRDVYTNLRFWAESLALEGNVPVEVEGLVLVRAPRVPEHLYGDRLRVHGELRTPPVFETFSYRDYLARQGIHSIVSWARIETLEGGQANPFYAFLLRFKRRAHAAIVDVLPEPSASLLSGILLGIEGGIPPELMDDFNATGTSHIIAISGFNMAIVGGLLASLSVRLFGRRYAAWFASVAIALYTLFVGGAAAVVRAAVMSCVAVWGQHFGRQNSAPNALFATALFMTAWNPHTLWDLGFLLSFAATLGLILFTEPLGRGLEGLLSRLLPVRWAEPAADLLHEPLVVSAASQLTTLPIVLTLSRTLSVFTLLSNALILPLQTQVMIWGAAAMVGRLLWRPLGRVLGWVAWLPLAGTIFAVEWTAGLPGAALPLGAVRPALLVGWYAVVGTMACVLRWNSERRREMWRALRQGLSAWFSDRLPSKLALGGLAVIALLVWLAAAAQPDGRTHVTFLDVGEGDAALIETPTGQQILINGGRSPSRLLAHLGKRVPFYDRSLDLIVLTDDRPGHLDGLLPVLERYRVDAVLYAPNSCRRPACARWEELLREQNVSFVPSLAGTRVEVGEGLRLTVLGSGAGRGTEVDQPILLRLDDGRTCVIFAGSAGPGVQRTLQRGLGPGGRDLRCDVLQVDGSKGADGLDALFLEAVRPALILLTGERVQDGAEGGEMILDRWRLAGTTIVSVDEVGNVEVITDGAMMDVKIHR
jgi:competence protein ComEC